jgi:hypothetical protein
MNQKVKIAKVSLGVFVILIVIGFMSSCEKYTYTPPTINPNDSVHFATEIQPIFNGICINCHNGAVSPDLRDGKSFSSLTTKGMITPPAETSKLYMKVISASHTARTSDIEKQKILVWINQGAHNN